MKPNPSRSMRIAAALLMAIAATGFVLAKENTTVETPKPRIERTDYKYPQSFTPENIVTNEHAAYTFTKNHVNTLKGDKMTHMDKFIIDMALNPGQINYVLVVNTGKKTEGFVYNFNEKEYTTHIPNSAKGVKYSHPTSVAYSPDARKVYLAADTTLRILDYLKFRPIADIDLPLSPTRMVVSPNGYLMAAYNGLNLAVVNLEDKNVRKTWKFESPITNVEFSHDNSQMAVLSADGMMTIYDTRNFIIRKSLDELGDGLSATWNRDGKYMAVLTKPDSICVINLLDDNDAPFIFPIAEGGASKLALITDANDRQLLVYNATNAMRAKRLAMLQPYYGKLISEEAQNMLGEWLKMMPGETMEAYQARVNEESRVAKLREFEDQVATGMAGDLLSMSSISLGKYDRDNELLQVNFSNMPSIFLPVPEAGLGNIHSGEDLLFTQARYGVMPNDRFELIYAMVKNRNNDDTYLYNNIDRVNLNNIVSDDNFVPIELIQQQQMEEIRLLEIREEVVAEAKKMNVISDHTHITVDSRVEPDFDANGKKISNYIINVSYEVEPEFSVVEDFAPGKYHAELSGAASSMMKLIKQTFEGDFSHYIADGKKLAVTISGTADATPIVGKIVYDGAFGEFENEPITQNGQMTSISVMPNELVKQNEQLAFLRAAGVKDYLVKNVNNLDKMNATYDYIINVSQDKGSEFRRITCEFKFFDIH